MLKPRKKINARQSPDGNSRPKSLSDKQYYQAQTRPNIQPNKDGKTAKKISLALIVVLGCVLFIINLKLSSSPNLRVSSENFRTKSEYQDGLNRLLDNRFLNNNKLTLNKQSLSDELKKQFPEISQISINAPAIGSTLRVDIIVIEPKLILKSNKDSYIIDERGRAVAKNTTVDSSKFVTINDQTAFDINTGKQVLSAEQVQFMQYIANQAKSKSIDIKELVLPPGSANELFMYLEDKPYFVKFIMDDVSADMQLGTYLAVRDQLSEQGKVPNEYIDVRVEGKAFVK